MCKIFYCVLCDEEWSFSKQFKFLKDEKKRIGKWPKN